MFFLQPACASRLLAARKESARDRYVKQGGKPKTEATERVLPGKSPWRATVCRGRGPMGHSVEGHAPSWPREKASADCQESGLALALNGRDGARPSRENPWRATVPGGRGPMGHSVEGHAPSWPQERHLPIVKNQVWPLPLTDATERVLPGKSPWRATVCRGREAKTDGDGAQRAPSVRRDHCHCSAGARGKSFVCSS